MENIDEEYNDEPIDIEAILKVIDALPEDQVKRFGPKILEYKLMQIEPSGNALEDLKTAKGLVSNYLLNAKPSEVKESILLLTDKFDLKTAHVRILNDYYKEQKQEYDKKAKEEKGGEEGTEDPLKNYSDLTITRANEKLDNGEAFEFILKVWQKHHVGDTNIGENCLCSAVARVILNSKRGLHIKPSGESGKGKSDAIESFLELLPDGSYISGSMSAKALFYDPDLKPGTLIYSDDASFTPDVISTIKQSTSKFQKPNYHITVVNGVSQKYPIPERVTFWFSAVEGMDDDQLANRFLHADVDASREQDEKVHKHQKDSEAWYESDEVDPDVLVCRCIFSILFSQTFRVKIPFLNAIQWNNIENRRNLEKFTDVIRAVAVFNYRKRDNFEGFILADVNDYKNALSIYKGTSVNNATNLTDTELKYIKFIVSKDDRTVTLKELVKHFNVTETAVRKMLNGKNGEGGLLSKIKQLVTEERLNTREKFYKYSGELTGLDMYAAVSSLDEEQMGRVTQEYKAQLLENKLRVTQGNPG